MPREVPRVLLVLLFAILAICPACSASKSSGWDFADAGSGPGSRGGSEGAVPGDGDDDDDDGEASPAPPPGDDASSPMDAATSRPDGPAPVSCGGTPARGAALSYQEYEAENASTNGTVIGPSRAVNDANVFNSIAGESSGREAVKLAGTGQHVQFTTACQANSIVVRYVIPDSSDGTGLSATLGLYVGGTRVQSLALTSQYAWAYGDPTSTDATTNNPGDGYARHFYDEVRVLLPNDIPVGTSVSLQQDASDTAAYYVIDLIDLEEVPAATGQPANSLSVTTCGATPNDGTDDGAAILNCMNQASKQGMIAWIPEGTFNNAGTSLAVNVTVQGAGMWRSTISGASAYFYCPGGPCSYSDLSLYGEVTLRDDANGVHAFGGAFGSGSTVENVWMEHFTVGAWVGEVNTPQTTGMTIKGCRVRDLFADGINLNTGTSNTTVTQTQVRSSGDDSFASWSSGPANSNNVFQFDTAQLPWRASCYSIYGGANNSVEDSVCADGITYPGIFVDLDFASTAFSGTTSVLRDDVLRSGGDMFERGWGGVTVAGPQMPSSPIVGVTISDVNVESATYAGVYLFGPNDPIQNLVLDNVTISQPGTYGILVDQYTNGNATASGVVVASPGSGGSNNAAGGAFTLARGAGNVGW